MTTSLQPDIKGVMMYCRGEREDNGQPEFGIIYVSPESPVFLTTVCEISDLVGIPVQIMDIDTPPQLNRSNQNAKYLKVKCHTSERTDRFLDAIGSVPREWQTLAGNVIVVRSDKKALDIELMQVLCDFCAVRMMRVLANASDMGMSGHEIQAIAEREFTKDAFREYAQEYRMREVMKRRSFSRHLDF